MAEVQVKAQGCLQLCQLSVDADRNEAMKVTEEEQLGGDAHLNPTACSVTHRGGSTASLDWEKTGLELSMAPQDWAHDLPSEERTLILPLFSKLWQERPQIPSPHPKNCLHADDLWIASKKTKQTKPSFIIQDYCQFILQLSVIR